jgi:hypothetical protein
MAADTEGNIWIASYGTDSVYVFLGGNPNQAVFHQEYPGSQPFGMVIAADGTAWVTNSGGIDGADPRSVAKFALVNGALQRQFLRFLGQALKGLALDSQGNGWITSQGNSSIYGLRPDGTRIGQFTGGGIDGPWGIAVDGEDNLWVANFGPLQPGSNFTDGRISELCGINRAACPPGKKLGDPNITADRLHGTFLWPAGFAAQRRPVVRSTTSTGRPQLRPIDASNECSDRPGWQHLGAQ